MSPCAVACACLVASCRRACVLRPTARTSSSCPQHVGCPSPHKSALPQASFDPARTCARATHDFYLLARSIICDPQKGSGGPVITPPPGTHQTLHRHLETDRGQQAICRRRRMAFHNRSWGAQGSGPFFTIQYILGAGRLSKPPSGQASRIQSFRSRRGPRLAFSN